MVTFANNIEKDILTAVANTDVPTEPVTDNYIKCSKSVVPNALYYISKGEQVEFFLGTIGSPLVSLVTHCWIEHNNVVAQTRVSSPDVKLFKNFSIMLSSDIETAKKEIRELIDFLLD